MPQRPVNDIFNQPPALENFNRFEANRALRDAVRREGADWAAEELAACGAELGSTEWIERGRLANDFPPRLNRFDRFGHPVQPEEWFLVPLHVIDEAVQRIRDGSITEFIYDPKTARLVGYARTHYKDEP